MGFYTYFVGLHGLVTQYSNFVVLLIFIEVMLLGLNYNVLLTSFYLNDIQGILFFFFILAVAAAESSIGLALIVSIFRVIGSITQDILGTLKN